MSKEIENIPGSANVKMNFATKSSGTGSENFQAGDSCIPITPLKPVLSKTRPICEQMQENWFPEEGLLFSSGSPRASEAYRAPARCETSKSIDIIKDFRNWEENLARGSYVFGHDHISRDPSGLQHGRFGMSLALANDAPPNDLEKAGNGNGESDDLPICKSTFDSNLFEASSATSSPAKEDMSYGTNLRSNNRWVPDTNSYGNSTTTHPMFDLNSPSTTSMDAFSSQNIQSQFAPITPDHPKKAKSRNDVQSLSLNGKPDQARDNAGDEIPTRIETEELLGKDLQQLPNCLSNTIESTQLQENHNHPEHDFIKTPQEKPRRKKHRPKVVLEGKPKRALNPATPKSERPKENTTVKRKYVRKSKVSEAPHAPEGDASANNVLKTAVPVTEKSCKRALNFDVEREVGEERDVHSESQVRNFSTSIESKSRVQLGEGIEIVLEKTQVGVAYDLNRSMNKVLEEYISAPETQSISPQTPNKTSPLERNMEGSVSNDHSKGKCQKNFLNEAQDKQDNNTTTMGRIKNQSASMCANNRGNQPRGLKRGNLQNSEDQNVIGRHFNPRHDDLAMCRHNSYNGNEIPDMYFPMIYKKKRSEKIYCSTISSSIRAVNTSQNGIHIAPDSSEYTSQGVASFVGSRGKEPNLQCGLDVDQKGKMKKKRSKVPTRVRDIASIMGMIERGQFSNFSTGRAPIFADMQTCGTSNQSLKSLALVAETRATVKTKKRTKRPTVTTCSNTGVLKKKHSTVEEITELLESLDINTKINQVKEKQKNKVVPFSFQIEDRNALVLYQSDGTIVALEGAFDPAKRRKPRPKVDLDEETNRVWRLLLENINNQGIDGTNDEKVKWWEEERRVFHGRVDSFIARMHLVQGDRRFSPWKGSVLDSVVGVFLTQNVSDHLSSSAFMSLASKYPLNSNGETCPSDGGTSVESKESEICISDLEDTTNRQGGKSNCSAEKKVHENESSITNTGKISTGSTSTNFLGISGKGLQFDNRTISDREAFELKDPMESSKGEIETDDGLSSQFSIGSSKDSEDSSVAQISASMKPCLHENREADPEPMSNFNNIIAPPFPKLLQMAGSSYGHHDKKANLYGFTITEGTGSETARLESLEITEAERMCFDNLRKCEEFCTSEQSEVTESASHLNVRKNVRGSNLKSNHARSSAKVDVNISKYVQIGDPNDNVQSERESTSVINITLSTEHKEVESSLNAINESITNCSKLKRKSGKEKQGLVNWDYLRVEAEAEGKRRDRTVNMMDSLDWEAVRCEDVNEIADTIRERGMNYKLAQRIKDFLNRLVKEHGSTDLEWLRDVPPDKAKEYLLSVRGLGLKSVECVRLLTLHHLAFPVDTNVGRIAVRLGWVPLQPLPESLQLHLLELYPVLESIQRYLWPRLCKLDQRTLYELHYQMITFGKVFCTKNKPNCNACPMRGECRHFASAFASARLALPASEDKRIVTATENRATYQNPVGSVQQLQLPLPPCNQQQHAQSQLHSVPIIEVLSTPEPVVEVPATPVFEDPTQIPDIEDAFWEDPDEIPIIKLNIEEFAQNLQNYMHQNMELQEGNVSKALVALNPEAASIPTPKLKNVSRLRTEHQVYELPDWHPLLGELDKREPDDPCSYLLAIWTPGETANSITPPEGKCSVQEFNEPCNSSTCFSCNSNREANSQTVRGTLLIPCRTAMRGNFPLNGTYFQVNEVFADHNSSMNPIDVPRAWIWNLPRRTVYFGTSIPTIFKGLSTESIQHCFWRGFVCVRGFDQKTRAPRPLMARLHFPASKLNRTRQRQPTNKQE